MSLDQLNLYLFHLLNVPDQASIWMINYASLIAHDLVYVFLLIFAIAWLRGSHEVKPGLLKLQSSQQLPCRLARYYLPF